MPHEGEDFFESRRSGTPARPCFWHQRGANTLYDMFTANTRTGPFLKAFPRERGWLPWSRASFLPGIAFRDHG